MVIYSSLGARLRAARIMRDMTGDYLAKLVGCHKSTITMLESGSNRRTSYAAAIAKALDVAPEWLEYGIGDPPWMDRPGLAIEEARRVLRQHDARKERGK